MAKFYFQYDNLGRVTSYSENPINTDSHQQIQLTVTPAELDLIKKNYKLGIQNGVLSITKSDAILKTEKDDSIEIDKQALFAKIQSNQVTAKEVANLLLKII